MKAGLSKSTNSQLKKICLALGIVALLFALGFLGRTIYLTQTTPTPLSMENVSSYLGVWNYSAGETQKAISLPYTSRTSESTFSITTIVDRDTLEKCGNTMIFYNNGFGVEVELNGEKIYSVNNSECYQSLSAYGYVIFGIDDTRRQTDVIIRFSNYTEGVCEIPDIMIGSRYAVAAALVQENIFPLAAIIFMAIVGLCLIAVSIVFSMKKIKDQRITAMAFLLIGGALWGFTEASFTAVIPISPEWMVALNYLFLLAIPLPIIYFCLHTCKYQYAILRFLVLGVIANIIVESLLAFLGVLTIETMYPIAYAMLIVSALVSLVLTIREYKLVEDRKISNCMIAAMFAIIISDVVIIFMQYVGTQKDYQVLFGSNKILLFALCFVILTFFAVVIMSYLNRIQAHRMEKMQMSVLEDLALKDKMTNLSNRRAFELRMAEFDENPRNNPEGILIILDLNGLKRINDDCGHAAGDEAIVAVSKAMKNIYALHGETYRIGGDEFAVIISDLSVDVRTLNQRFSSYLDKVNLNSEIKISVAKGVCELYDGMGRRYSTDEWKQNADLSMYADKKLARAGADVKRAEDLQSILDCVIGLVEAKDQYTANHSERVRELSVLIGGWMNLSPTTIEQIDLAAHLHDIGKVGIPESILLKPGRLTDDEFTVMKQHPVIGARVIERAKNLTEVSEIVLHHHERYDGKGYPDGISREEIPMGARIVAVADSIDAMTSRRCYRDSLGLDICRDEVERNLGKMYDPAIGKIVLDHWSDISEVVQRG